MTGWKLALTKGVPREEVCRFKSGTIIAAPHVQLCPRATGTSWRAQRPLAWISTAPDSPNEYTAKGFIRTQDFSGKIRQNGALIDIFASRMCQTGVQDAATPIATGITERPVPQEVLLKRCGRVSFAHRGRWVMREFAKCSISAPIHITGSAGQQLSRLAWRGLAVRRMSFRGNPG